MLIILIRTIVLYFIILFVMRVMGKAELSKMSPFQMIVSFMIAELAAMPIESPDISMISGVTAIFTLLFLQVLISLLSIKSERLKNLFSGSPSILIEKGKINKKEMKRLRLTISDLLEAAPHSPASNMRSWNPTGTFPSSRKRRKSLLPLQIFLLQSHLNPCRSS